MRKDPHAHVIHAPRSRLLASAKLRFVRERAGGKGRRGVTASINMASFLDVMIVTVLFLLNSFSASADCPERAGKIPAAVNVDPMFEAPMVSVGRGQILVDGLAVGSTRAIVESGRLARLDDLGRLLEQKKALWKTVQPQKPFPGAVVLQIEQDVPAVVVKSVFQTAVSAGYPSVSFMVQKLDPRIE
jgi:biopolymer transport protein ExbD